MRAKNNSQILFDRKDSDGTSIVQFLDGNRNMWKLLSVSLFKMEQDMDIIDSDVVLDRIRENINDFCDNTPLLDEWVEKMNVSKKQKRG